MLNMIRRTEQGESVRTLGESIENMTAEPRIPTNLRMLLILEILGERGEPMRAAEIGREIGLPKQTVNRLCTTLLDEGLLVREEHGNRLRPGRRARTMANGVLHAASDHILRHQILAQLAESVGETVNFAVPEIEGMVYRDRVETNWFFRIQLPVGSHVPFHCTASGKCYLASLPPARRKALVENLNLEAQTPQTLVNRTSLLEELHLIARQGYSMDNEELVEGMIAIAAPVSDRDGRFVAAVAFHGPAQRLTADAAVGHLPKLQNTANRLRDWLF